MAKKFKIFLSIIILPWKWISIISSPVDVEGPGKKIIMALSIIFCELSSKHLNVANLGLVGLKKKIFEMFLLSEPEILIILIALFDALEAEEYIVSNVFYFYHLLCFT